MPQDVTVGKKRVPDGDCSESQRTGELHVVSGGQTGVDQAALQAAIEVGLSHGGWCPRGRKCETGVIPMKYQLTELKSERYSARTKQNVIDSDATLILYRGVVTGGTLLTQRLATSHGKSFLLVDLLCDVPAENVSRWVDEHDVRVLNVAGPRESSCVGIFDQAREYLECVFRKVMQL